MVEINHLAEKVSPYEFVKTFGAGVNNLEILVQNKTVTLAKLMDIAPEGTVDPTACDLSKTSLYRPVMRSEKGPWKSDQNAVYLFMMYDEGERVIFNGGNKSLEGGSLLVTDANGVHIGPTIIKEAKEPGEDGFFLYLWDDPRTKEDDVYDPGGAPGISPKLGYVKALDLPKSDRVIIFGSGIYPKVEKVEKGCAVAGGKVIGSKSAVFNLLLIVSAVFPAVLLRNCSRCNRT
jgi:hypothetical protein